MNELAIYLLCEDKFKQLTSGLFLPKRGKEKRLKLHQNTCT